MATELIGIGGMGAELALTAFEKRLIKRYRAKAVYNRYGVKRSIPRRGGKAIQFRKLESIYPAGTAGSGANASAPAALTEGTPGAEINATWTSVSATVNQYGQYLKISDMSEEQSIDNVAAEYVDALAESMTDALDLVTRDVLMGGSNVQYASIAATRGGASGVGSGMYLTLAELREAKRTLKRNNVPGVMSEDGQYVVITHPDAAFDLEGDTNITNFFQYAAARGGDNPLFKPTWRDLPLGFRMFETTNCRIFSDAGLSAADVYGTLVLGDEAYGVVALEALPARVITKDRGSGGTSDPLDQLSTVGWKAAHTAVRLQEANMVRIEHVTSANNMG